MEATDIKQLMAEYNHKLDEIIDFNKETAMRSLQLKNSQNRMHTLLLYRIFELIFYIFIVIFIGSFISRHWDETYFVISGLIVELFAIISLIGVVGQIVLANQIDYSRPIVEIRKKIELVNAHGFLFLKLILLSLPVWWSYAIVGLYLFLGIDIYPHLEPDFVIRYLAVNGLLIVPLIWFLNKLSYKNLHIRWVRRTIEILTPKKIRKALNSLKDIESFEV